MISKRRQAFGMQGSMTQRRAAQTESEDPLETRPIHPSGRAGVPGPAAAADVGGLGVDIGAGDVRFDLVAVNAGARAGVIDRVQQRKQLAGLVAVAEHREGDHRPDGAVRVLAAVLPDAGRVAFDVAGVERRLIERRREEQEQSVVAADEVFVHAPPSRSRRGLGSRRRRSRPTTARSNRCGIRLLACGAERRSVVEEGAQVPVAVPAFALQRPRQRGGVLPPGCGPRLLAAAIRQRRRKPTAWREETSRARCSRPCRPRRRDSGRRSSLRCRSAAGRGCRPQDCWSSARAQCSNSVPCSSRNRRLKERLQLVGLAGPARRETAPFRRERRRRR